jgi:hypothetical protein
MRILINYTRKSILLGSLYTKLQELMVLNEKIEYIFLISLQARQAAAEAAFEDDQDTSPAQVEQRTPQLVIDKLFQARGELDVIYDLIIAVEQQQFVSLSHVPVAKNPARVLQQAALNLARRKEQLRCTSERIRTGTSAAREQAQIADRFLQDLSVIRKQWRLCRRMSSSGGNVIGSFYVDLSLPIEKRRGKYIEESSTSNRGSVMANIEVNIVQSAEGEACVAAEETTAGKNAKRSVAVHPLPVKVIKGPESISEELQRRFNLHSWQIIEKLISQEAKRSSNTGAAAAVVVAILKMAALATAKRAEILSNAHTRNVNTHGGEDTAMVDAEEEVFNLEKQRGFSTLLSSSSLLGGGLSLLCSAEKCLAEKDIELYCSTFTSQLEFEARALRCLAFLCRDAETPELIKQTRGGDGGGSGGGGETSILKHLTHWLRHAALCYAVEQSLLRQMSEFTAVTAITSAAVGAEENERKWVISKDARPLGVLAVEDGGSVLRWYGPNLVGLLTGQGQELGRTQLETFIEKLLL